MAFVFLLTCMMNTFSIFIKSKKKLLVFTGVFIVLSNYLSKNLPTTFKILSPFIYLRADKLADGSISIFESMPDLSFSKGISTILVSSLIFIIIGSLSVRYKRNVS